MILSLRIYAEPKVDKFKYMESKHTKINPYGNKIKREQCVLPLPF